MNRRVYVGFFFQTKATSFAWGVCAGVALAFVVFIAAYVSI